MSYQPDTNIYQLPATNPEFMLEQSSSCILQPSVTHPGVAYPQPVNRTGDGQQTKETQFAPASDVATNYSVNQPPLYDSNLFGYS